jgi:hypothetical protein
LIQYYNILILEPEISFPKNLISIQAIEQGISCEQEGIGSSEDWGAAIDPCELSPTNKWGIEPLSINEIISNNE